MHLYIDKTKETNTLDYLSTILLTFAKIWTLCLYKERDESPIKPNMLHVRKQVTIPIKVSNHLKDWSLKRFYRLVLNIIIKERMFDKIK